MAIQKVTGPNSPFTSIVNPQNSPRAERKNDAVSVGQSGGHPNIRRNHTEVKPPEVYTKDKIGRLPPFGQPTPIRDYPPLPRNPVGRLPGAGNPTIQPVNPPIERVGGGDVSFGPPDSFRVPTVVTDEPLGPPSTVPVDDKPAPPSPALSVRTEAISVAGTGKGGLKVEG